MKASVATWGRWDCLAADCGSKVHSFGKWVAANCAVLPTAYDNQYATLNCKPLLFQFPCKLWYINVWTFNSEYQQKPKSYIKPKYLDILKQSSWQAQNSMLTVKPENKHERLIIKQQPNNKLVAKIKQWKITSRAKTKKYLRHSTRIC